MARNAEKAMSTLARWRDLQRQEEKNVSLVRPYNPSDCRDLKQAERWRSQIISEISRLVTQIQNTTLPDNKVRDMNDNINKLLREKANWEKHILTNLNGPDYLKLAANMFDSEGASVAGMPGYKYFGTAKNLPGVRELFEEKALVTDKKSRAALEKNIHPSYYGYYDEDDPAILEEERAHEALLLSQAHEEYNRTHTSELAQAGLGTPSASTTNQYLDQNALTQEQIESLILQSRRKELYRDFLGED